MRILFSTLYNLPNGIFLLFGAKHSYESIYGQMVFSWSEKGYVDAAKYGSVQMNIKIVKWASHFFSLWFPKKGRFTVDGLKWVVNLQFHTYTRCRTSICNALICYSTLPPTFTLPVNIMLCSRCDSVKASFAFEQCIFYTKTNN